MGEQLKLQHVLTRKIFRRDGKEQGPPKVETTEFERSSKRGLTTEAGSDISNSCERGGCSEKS